MTDGLPCLDGGRLRQHFRFALLLCRSFLQASGTMRSRQFASYLIRPSDDNPLLSEALAKLLPVSTIFRSHGGESIKRLQPT